MGRIIMNPLKKEVFRFGKYKGVDIEGVIHNDPRYVEWAEENVSFFSLSSIQKEILKEEIEKLDSKHEVSLLMHRYGIHATEAIDFIEYDYPEYF